VNLAHPFRTLLRRFGRGKSTPPRRISRLRLCVTPLEDRVVPTSTPFSVDRPDGYNHFFSAAAVDGQGNTDFVYTGVAVDGTLHVYLASSIRRIPRSAPRLSSTLPAAATTFPAAWPPPRMAVS
jgi:hypothetical protein